MTRAWGPSLPYFGPQDISTICTRLGSLRVTVPDPFAQQVPRPPPTQTKCFARCLEKICREAPRRPSGARTRRSQGAPGAGTTKTFPLSLPLPYAYRRSRSPLLGPNRGGAASAGSRGQLHRARSLGTPKRSRIFFRRVSWAAPGPCLRERREPRSPTRARRLVRRGHPPSCWPTETGNAQARRGGWSPRRRNRTTKPCGWEPAEHSAAEPKLSAREDRPCIEARVRLLCRPPARSALRTLHLMQAVSRRFRSVAEQASLRAPVAALLAAPGLGGEASFADREIDQHGAG